MSPAPHRIYGIGQCSLDYVVSVESLPVPDEKREFQELTIDGGGPVATGLVALSRWGARCCFAGVVGDDEFGAAIRGRLEAEAVDCDDLQIRSSSVSQFAFAVAAAEQDSRTIFWRRPTGAPLSPADLSEAKIRASHLLYTDGLFADASLHGARIARDAGVPVVVDAGTLREGMLDLARISNAFVASHTFARALVGGDDPRAACRRLAELGPELVGVTLGEHGYLALARGVWIEGRAHAARVVDTTGCGDAFHAGIAHGWLRRWPVETCLDFGAWAAAHVAAHFGGRRGIPRAEDYAPAPPRAERSPGP